MTVLLLEDFRPDDLECLDTGEQPDIAVEKGSRATAITFGVRESSRRRGRVEPPQEIEATHWRRWSRRGSWIRNPTNAKTI